MAQFGLVNNPGVSRFQKTVPTVKYLREQIVGETRKQLEAEAATMLPDGQALANLLMEQDLHESDFSAASAQLNSVISNYMDEYRKNPFYTFTAEGRQQLNAARNIVRSPELKKARERKKANDLALEVAKENDVLGAPYVNKGRVAVQRGNGVQFVSTIQDGDIPLNVSQVYRLADAGVISRFEVDMSKPSDVLDAVEKAFSDLGDTEYDQLFTSVDFGDLTKGVRTNVKQIAAAEKALLEGGLTSADWNSLIAMQYSDGATNLTDAKRKALKYVQGIAESKTKTKNNFSSISGRSGRSRSAGDLDTKGLSGTLENMMTGNILDFEEEIETAGGITGRVMKGKANNAFLYTGLKDDAGFVSNVPISENQIISATGDQNERVSNTMIKAEDVAGSDFLEQDDIGKRLGYLGRWSEESAVALDNLDNVIIDNTGDTQYITRKAQDGSDEIYAAVDVIVINPESRFLIGDWLDDEFEKLGDVSDDPSVLRQLESASINLNKRMEAGAPTSSALGEYVKNRDRLFKNANIRRSKLYYKISKDEAVARARLLEGNQIETPESMTGGAIVGDDTSAIDTLVR